MYTLEPLPLTELVCDRHFHYGQTPCPWPACVNGTEHDEFQMERHLFAEEATQYKRHQWTSPSGQAYFSWLDDTWRPSFLASPNLVDREMLRIGVRPPIDPLIAYHYTDLGGLKGILDSQEMWLTDYEYLNDSSELNHGLAMVKQKLREAVANPKYENVADSFTTWIAGLDHHQHRICVTSYSYDGDSLSQWRAYGSVAIGFKVNQALGAWSGECTISSVIYNRAHQERYLDFFINHVSQAYELDKKSDSDSERLKELYSGGAHTAINLAASFKNEGFSDEREVRVAYVENPEYFKIGMTPATTRFRVSGDAIIPYVTTGDLSARLSNKELPIVSIVVGPTISPTGEKSIRAYLKHLGLDNVSVTRSSIPYRESRK
jgi:hypothetical protein